MEIDGNNNNNKRKSEGDMHDELEWVKPELLDDKLLRENISSYKLMSRMFGGQKLNADLHTLLLEQDRRDCDRRMMVFHLLNSLFSYVLLL